MTQKFWEYYNSISDLSKDSDALNVQLFKSDVQPLWEAPENVSGGKWVCFLRLSVFVLFFVV